jgi:hypothetical protein
LLDCNFPGQRGGGEEMYKNGGSAPPQLLSGRGSLKSSGKMFVRVLLFSQHNLSKFNECSFRHPDLGSVDFEKTVS